MDLGCQMEDYRVTIGNGFCKVVHLLTNELTCEPPIAQPDLEEYPTKEYPKVVVCILL